MMRVCLVAAATGVMAIACGGSDRSNGDAGGDAVNDAAIDADEGTGFRVAGMAVGVRDPLELVLSSATLQQTITITEDGAFRFPRRLADGSQFSIQLASPQTCDLNTPTGTIAGADAALVLTCDGVGELSSVSFNILVLLSPRFDPRHFSYTGTEPMLVDATDPVTITATQADPTATLAFQPAMTTVVDTPISVTVTRAPLAPTTYTFALSRALQQETLIKSDTPLANAHLGGATLAGSFVPIAATGLSLSGDTLVIGAPGEGKVYVYERAGATAWALRKIFSGGAGSKLGQSVVVDGDTLVMGDPADASNAGAAFVARRTLGLWGNPVRLDPQPAPPAGSRFGASVALSGTLAAVGAPGGDGVGSNFSRQGAVRVFTDSGTTFNQSASYTNGTNGNYGSAVALSGTTLAVGAPVNGTGELGTVFVLDAVTGVEQLQTSGPASQSHLGAALGLDGDLLAAGAPDEASQAGRVHVFRRSGTTWSPEVVLQAVPAPPSPSLDQFGFAVAVDRGHIVVGANGEDCGGRGIDPPCGVTINASGAAYFFRKVSGNWVQNAYTKASNTALTDRFGTSVAVDGDTFAVGAPFQDTTSTDSGAVYVFR